MTESNNKRIAKNTLMLYIRMFFVMGVGLYTSRIVLQALGVSDFGIYGVVGGVVAMMAFLNQTLTGASKRFLTVSIGKGDQQMLKKTFVACIVNHGFIILLILLFAETLGLWFVNTQLNIESSRIEAMNWVYQMSILTVCLNFIEVPFFALIIARERMQVYSIVSIITTVLKLFLVYMLVVANGDRLILYSIIMLAIPISSFISYFLYCRKYLEESRGVRLKYYDFKIAKPILLFSVWDIYGNFTVVARNQGINILQNIFFGTIINASVSIANRVLSAIMGFASNVLMAVQPQIIKKYAQDDIKSMQELLEKASLLSFVLMLLISVPFIVDCEYILNLWLVEVPDYAVVFCQLSIVASAIGIIFSLLTTAIHATGKIKEISFLTGSLLLLSVPISYLALKYTKDPIIPFIINIVVNLACGFMNLYITKKHIASFSVSSFLKKVVLHSAIILILFAFVGIIISYNIDAGLLRILIVVSTLVIISSTYVLFCVLNEQDRMYFLSKVKAKLK